MTHGRRLLLAVLASLAAACGGDGPVDPGNGTPTVQSVTLNSSTTSIQVGATVAFSASARDSDGGNVTGVTVGWSSSDAQVASIGSDGVATGVSEGQVTITGTIQGVSGTRSLVVVSDACENRQTVSLSAGATASFPATECILLPAGASGDRYRVAFARVSEVGNPSDVITASVQVTAQAAAQGASPALQAPPPAEPAASAAPGGSIAAVGIDGTQFIEALKRSEATRRFHARLRAQEYLMGFGESPLPDRPRQIGAALVDPPATASFNTAFDCTASPQPAQLVTFNDDIAIYQDSVQRALSPIGMPAATRLAAFYTDYVKDMIPQYWGALSDLDQNGRLVVTTSPTLADSVLGAVWSGDLSTTGTCLRGNRMEIVYLSSANVAAMDNSENPSFATLGTLAHEVKHVVSLRNRVIASQSQGGVTALFHPLWYEEGQAELAESVASRIAWAATGGPPLGTAVTGAHIVDAVNKNAGRQTPEMWGVVEKLANLIVQQSTHPNSLLTNPSGADEFHTFYAGGWHLARFLGDAYGGAIVPHADAPLFLQLNDQSTLTGSARLAQVTGKTFATHLEELVIGAMLHGTGAPAPQLGFTTYDFVTATDVFTAPEVLRPDGDYPWPVTATSDSNPAAGFVTATYSGPVGPAAWRIHEFLSSGTGLGIQLQFDGDADARIIVARIR